jgi:Kef-type K+ transport system membrane component KefB
MFVIGMELDIKLKNNSEAIVISHASIVIPFAMGIGLILFVYNICSEGLSFFP